MRLSIIIPAHNEENRIGPMLDLYLPHFDRLYGSDVEFLVVVNGSTDRTAEVVQSYRTRYPALRCVVEQGQVGKGGALMVGFAQACGDLVGFVDADGATAPPAFQDLVDRIKDADAIIASRWCRGAVLSPPQPLKRRIASRCFNLLTRILFGLRLTDTQCGAKVIRRDAVRQVLPRLGLTRWAFDVDLLFQLKRAGFTIAEIPTEWHDVAGSKIEIARVSSEMLAAIVRLRLLYSPFRGLVKLYNRYLGPFIHPAGMEQDRLFRHSLLLMGGAQVSNVCNVLFQIAMVRMLTKVDYGVLAAMLGLIGTLSMPIGALARTVAHFAAHLAKAGRVAEIKALMASLARDMTLVAVLLLAAGWAGRDWLSGFFRLDSSVPILLCLVTLAINLYVPLFGGAVHGLQAFMWTTAVGAGGSFARLSLAVLLVSLGGGAVAGLSANVGATLLSLGLSTYAVFGLLRGSTWKPARVPGVYRYFIKYMFAYLGFAVLSLTDVALVKHYFPALDAGEFAVAAVVARIVIFLPQPVVGAMFPKVVSAGGTSYTASRTLLKAIILVCAIIGITVLACTAVPGFVIRVLTGQYQPAMVPLVRGMVWALSPLSLVFVLMNFELAQRRFKVTFALLGGAAAYVIGVALWHGSLMQVIAVLAAVSTGTAIASALCMPWRAMGQAPDPRGDGR